MPDLRYKGEWRWWAGPVAWVKASRFCLNAILHCWANPHQQSRIMSTIWWDSIGGGTATQLISIPHQPLVIYLLWQTHPDGTPGRELRIPGLLPSSFFIGRSGTALRPRRVVLQGQDQGGSLDFPQQTGIKDCSDLPSVKEPNKTHSLTTSLLARLSKARLFNIARMTSLFLETVRTFMYFSPRLLLSSLCSRSCSRFPQPAKTKKNPHQINKPRKPLTSSSSFPNLSRFSFSLWTGGKIFPTINWKFK